MSAIEAVLSFSGGLVLGGGIVWIIARARFMSEAQVADKFKALAADTLRQNNETFLQLAESRLKQSEQAAATTLEKKTTAVDELIKPVKESLQKMGEHLQALEVKREGAYSEVLGAIKMSNETQAQLRGETSQLLQALRSPTSRGRWGEIQLKRILEMTGMSAHAKDFTSQQSLTTEDGTLRPDCIVYLPNQRCIIIDSKVPLTGFMEATHSTDETARQNALKAHAKQVRDHVKALSAKAYWDQVEGTAEMVVLFMPGDHFYSAALDHDPELDEFSIGKNIVLATPMTLVGILRTMAYDWRQENLRENTRRIGALGGELYTSLLTMTDYITSLGGKLSGALDSYNKLIGNFDRKVLAKARRLRDFGAGQDSKILPEVLEPIDLQPRVLSFSDAPDKEEDAA